MGKGNRGRVHFDGAREQVGEVLDISGKLGMARRDKRGGEGHLLCDGWASGPRNFSMNSFMENLSATFASLEKDREFVGIEDIDKFGG